MYLSYKIFYFPAKEILVDPKVLFVRLKIFTEKENKEIQDGDMNLGACRVDPVLRQWSPSFTQRIFVHVSHSWNDL